MKKLLILLIMVILMQAALAEAIMPADAYMPADATLISEETMGSLRLLRLATDAGENMVLLLGDDGAPVYLTTTREATAEASEEQNTGDIKTTVIEAFPGAFVLQEESAQNGTKAVRVVAQYLSGTVWVKNDVILRRDLSGGHFLDERGRLTVYGALFSIKLIRPDAVVIAVEYEDDDDVFEGDALMNGEEYEFAIDASTSRLLEWERD